MTVTDDVFNVLDAAKQQGVVAPIAVVMQQAFRDGRSINSRAELSSLLRGKIERTLDCGLYARVSRYDGNGVGPSLAAEVVRDDGELGLTLQAYALVAGEEFDVAAHGKNYDFVPAQTAYAFSRRP